MKNRLLNIEGVINFRDLGGYQGLDNAPVTWGKVYRSAQLDRLTEHGVRKMAALGIKTVVDLRFNDETERYPTVQQAFPDADFISWQSELAKPLVFHCAAGKDRTGVAAALILSLLGVSNEDVVEDYLVSQSQVAHLLDTWVGGGATDSNEYDDFQKRLGQYPRELIQPVFDADVEYIRTLLDYVDQTYQNFETYALTTLELDQNDLAGLRQRLLA